MNDAEVVLVTGASYGLGSEIAKHFAARALKLGRDLVLVLTARSEERLRAVAAEIQLPGVRTQVIAADLESTEDRRRIADTVLNSHGRIDVFISNAALSPFRLFEDLSVDEIDSILIANALAPLSLCRSFLPSMIARGRGAIVLNASMAGKYGLPFNAAYSASKGALILWAQAMQSELRGTGVGVRVICPMSISRVGVSARGGQKTPWILGEVTPERVCQAIYRAAHGGPLEVVISKWPIRPLLAAVQLIPALGPAAVRWLGVTKMYAAIGRPSRTLVSGRRTGEPRLPPAPREPDTGRRPGGKIGRSIDGSEGGRTLE